MFIQRPMLSLESPHMNLQQFLQVIEVCGRYSGVTAIRDVPTDYTISKVDLLMDKVNMLPSGAAVD